MMTFWFVLARYLLAEDNDALYVSFIGTKQRRDIMTNANIMQENLWPDLPIAADSQVGLPVARSCVVCSLQPEHELPLCFKGAGASSHTSHYTSFEFCQ